MASLRIALLVAMILTVATLASASRGFMRMSWEEREAFLKVISRWPLPSFRPLNLSFTEIS